MAGSCEVERILFNSSKVALRVTEGAVAPPCPPPNCRAVGSQSAPPWTWADAAPDAARTTAKVAKNRRMSLCMPTIWHSERRPASADCLGLGGPLFCHPDRKTVCRSTDYGRRPSQQLQGPEIAQGRRQDLYLFQPGGGRETDW